MAIVGPEKSWRLVHDGSKVILLQESTGYTETMHTIFEAATKAECDAEIARLNLQPLPTPPPKPVDPRRSITPLQFMDRFSEATQLAVVTAAQSNPAIKLWYDRLLAASTVELDSERVINGVNAMVAAGVITQQEGQAALA